MKKFNKIILAMMLVASSISVYSCGNEAVDNDVVDNSIQSENIADNQDEEEQDDSNKLTEEQLDSYLPIIDNVEQLPQLSELEEGETIATLKTSMGDISIRFFEEYAPMAVENFLTLAEEGYYDGIVFHRVIDDFMIQGGDPTGIGTGGESIYGGKFDDEITPYLRHFSGAVAMANSGSNTNGSQFYIVENDELSAEEIAYYEQFVENPKDVYVVDSYTGTEFTNDRFFSPVVAEEYIENGGTPFLDFNYTIFGQVIDGMDVVHAIGEVETYDGTNGQQDKPVEDVVINSIEITQYTKE